MEKFSYKLISIKDEDLIKQVIEIGNQNSKTLGFMPEGAYYEQARKHWIIVALSKKQVVGYLMFRLLSRSLKVSISQLSIKEEFRGYKIADKLIDELKNKYKNSRTEINLNCREDYKYASKLWKRNDFIPASRKRSRSIEENYLIKWIYNFNVTNLFTEIERDDDKIEAVIDMNILIELNESNTKVSSKYLMQDWLVDLVKYNVTSECYIEINRDQFRHRAEKTLDYLKTFPRVQTNSKVDDLYSDLVKRYTPLNENEKSDIKQLAISIGNEIKYFITYDEGILNKSDEVYKLYNLKILNPTDFLNTINELNNPHEFQPKDIIGSTFKEYNVGGKLRNLIISNFVKNEFGEKIKEFRSILDKYNSYSNNQFFKVLVDNKNAPKGIYKYDVNKSIINVKLIRSIQKNSDAIFQQLITEIIEYSVSYKYEKIIIHEQYFKKSEETVLTERGFIKENNNWIKLNVYGIKKFDELKRFYEANENIFFDKSKFEAAVNDKNTNFSKIYLFEIEKSLFPLKFGELDIPTYIIPIKPYWASQLFDKYLSDEQMFKASVEKIWLNQNVYFRSARLNEERYSRILWYYSDDNKLSRKKGIAATSYVVNVEKGEPKILFNKYKKYGIYEYKNVDAINKSNNGEVKVIVFNNTELFNKLIPYDEINKIFMENGRKINTFAGPVKVNNNIFNEIYLRGIKS